MDILESFWKHVDKRGPMDCWNWIGAIDKDGYGRFRHKRAHRISYMIDHGSIGVDNYGYSLMIAHHCGNKKCVNPNHLCATTSEGISQINMKKDYLGLKLKDIIDVTNKELLKNSINKLPK